MLCLLFFYSRGTASGFEYGWGGVERVKRDGPGPDRRYGESIDEVLAWSGQAAARLALLQSSDDRLAELDTAVAALSDAVTASAARLTSARRGAAARFEAAVGAELAPLAMGSARVQGAVTCLLYTSPSPRDRTISRIPSSA